MHGETVKFLCNLAGTDHELPENDKKASKHVVAI